MATNTYTVGSGGDYASVSLWASARSSATSPGDTEVCLLLDSAAASAGGTILFQSSVWKNGNIIRFKGNTPHNGVPGAGITKNSGTWFLGVASATNTLHFECEDLEFDLAGIGDWNRTVLQWANSATDNFPIGNMTFRRCLVDTYNDNRAVCAHELSVASNTYSFTTRFENCVFRRTSSGAGRIMNSNLTGSGDRTIEFVGCTVYESQINILRNGSGAVNLTATGCLFKPYSTNAEYQTSGSSGTLSATSSYCITSRTSAQHTSIFGTTSNNTYSVSFVTGNPASGQVGFTDISTGDFSLYDDADNIAIDYVDAVMPADDIAGVSRPQGTLYDAGAFELEAAAGTELTPGSATLTTTPTAPTVSVTDHKELTPAASTLTTTPTAPTVSVSDHKELTPAASTLTTTPSAPTVTVSTTTELTPSAATLTTTPSAPTVTVSTTTELTPSAATLTLATFAPSVTVGVGSLELTPGAATVVLTGTVAVLDFGVVVGEGLLSLSPEAAPDTIPELEVTGGPTSVVTYGVFDQGIELGPGDEWYVTFDGPSADTPFARITLTFNEHA